jgi:hypothetical protein
MRLRLTLACLVAATTAPLLVATPANAACVTSTRTIVGTVSGQDGRWVDALVGLDLISASGAHIDATPGSASFGCGGKTGYGLTIRVNRDLGATGSTTQGSWTKSWKAVVPTNVTMMYVEVYPQAAGYGGTNESRYGHALRRKVPVPYGHTVTIKLPLICSAGGTTGKIGGWVTKGGVKTQADRVAAWSMANDNNTANPILGWNMGSPKSDGSYVIPNLPPGQYYTIQFSKGAVMIQKYNIWVNACKGTYFAVNFT